MRTKPSTRLQVPFYLAGGAVAVYSVFYLVALLLSFGMSLTNMNASRPLQFQFVGLDNFFQLLSESGFRAALVNTFVFALGTAVAKTVLGTVLALGLNRSFRFRSAVRSVWFLPYVLSPVAVAYVFAAVFHPTEGLLNGALKGLGLGGLAHDWLGDPTTALVSVMAVEVWIGIGFTMTIMLASLQSIPQDLIEAASLDGAGRLKSTVQITLPLLWPTILLVTGLNLITGFRVFDLVQAMTNGGPGFATEVVASFQYKALGLGALGYASAVGLIQFLCIALIAIPFLRRTRGDEL